MELINVDVEQSTSYVERVTLDQIKAIHKLCNIPNVKLVGKVYSPTLLRRLVNDIHKKFYATGAENTTNSDFEIKTRYSDSEEAKFVLEFADPEVKRILVEHFDRDIEVNGVVVPADGEIDETEASSILTINNYFENSSIETFNELNLLPITELGNGAFKGSTVKYINLEKITTMHVSAFKRSGIVKLYAPKLSTFTGSINNNDDGMFSGCINLKELIITGNVVNFPKATNVNSWGPDSHRVLFYNTYNLEKITFPASYVGNTDIFVRYDTSNQQVFYNKLIYIRFLGNNGTLTNNDMSALNYEGVNCRIYVPDDSVDTYKSRLSNLSTRIFPLSDCPDPIPE